MKKFNLLVPAAGSGKRFRDVGYITPKPFLTVGGKRLIDLAIDCVPAEFVAEKHIVVSSEINRMISGAHTHWEAQQRGQASSVLYGLEQLSEKLLDEPIMVLNCDQVMTFGEQQRKQLLGLLRGGHQGVVFTFAMDPPESEHKKWSYVLPRRRFSGNMIYPTYEVDGVIEKPSEPLPGGKAIIGVFAFASARLLKRAIEDMVALDHRVNGEFYLAPAINGYLSHAKPIRWCPAEAHGIGTPEDLDHYCRIYHETDGDILLKDEFEPIWRTENKHESDAPNVEFGLIPIILNGHPIKVHKIKIAYEDLVGVVISRGQPMDGFSVTYRTKDSGNRSGILMPGQEVEVEAGMIFDCVRTNRA